jgi:hypothetical protein
MSVWIDGCVHRKLGDVIDGRIAVWVKVYVEWMAVRVKGVLGRVKQLY